MRELSFSSNKGLLFWGQQILFVLFIHKRHLPERVKEVKVGLYFKALVHATFSVLFRNLGSTITDFTLASAGSARTQDWTGSFFEDTSRRLWWWLTLLFVVSDRHFCSKAQRGAVIPQLTYHIQYWWRCLFIYESLYLFCKLARHFAVTMIFLAQFTQLDWERSVLCLDIPRNKCVPTCCLWFIIVTNHITRPFPQSVGL